MRNDKGKKNTNKLYDKMKITQGENKIIQREEITGVPRTTARLIGI